MKNKRKDIYLTGTLASSNLYVQSILGRSKISNAVTSVPNVNLDSSRTKFKQDVEKALNAKPKSRSGYPVGSLHTTSKRHLRAGEIVGIKELIQGG